MILRQATTATQLLNSGHLHVGRVHKIGGMKALLGIATGTSRKIEAFDAKTSEGSESVALNIDINRFMVTLAKSFVLLTLQEGTERKPVIHKSWRRTSRNIGKGLTEDLGTEDKYIDTDNLTWEHQYKRRGEPDELVAFDEGGTESLVLTLETIQ